MTKLLTLQFVIPYSKAEITDPKLKDLTYKNFVCSILRCLPTTHAESVTCVKSYVSKHAQEDSKLECIQIIGPTSLENEFKTFVKNGITYKGRNILPYQTGDASSGYYPKQFTLKLRNLPHFIEDKEILTACELNDFKVSKLRHQKEKISDDFEAYNGICYADIQISNEEQLSKLKSWNNSSFTKKFSLDGTTFKCHIQKLLECNFCKDQKLHFMGHHVKQCKLKTKRNDPPNNPVDQSSSEDESTHEMTEENPIVKDPHVTFYMDVVQRKIANVVTLNKDHPGLIDHPAVQRGNSISITNEQKKEVTELLPVQKLNTEEQIILFEKYSWRIAHQKSPLKDYKHFEQLRNKYDVYLNSTLGGETLFLVNFHNNISITLVLHKN